MSFLCFCFCSCLMYHAELGSVETSVDVLRGRQKNTMGPLFCLHRPMWGFAIDKDPACPSSTERHNRHLAHSTRKAALSSSIRDAPHQLAGTNGLVAQLSISTSSAFSSGRLCGKDIFLVDFAHGQLLSRPTRLLCRCMDCRRIDIFYLDTAGDR